MGLGCETGLTKRPVARGAKGGGRLEIMMEEAEDEKKDTALLLYYIEIGGGLWGRQR